MRAATPLGALGRGLVSGAAGAVATGGYFAATKSIAPAWPPDAFTPPELEQQGEFPHETMARRIYSGMLARGPMTAEQKKRGGNILQILFGARWGALYGLSRETFPQLATPVGLLGYGTLVWAASYTLILPLFRLQGPLHKYPPRVHAYLWGAHLVYAGALGATYELLRPRSLLAAVGALWSLRLQGRVSRMLPKRMRPLGRRTIRALTPIALWRPSFRAAAEALA